MSISFAFEESISCLNHKFIKNIINFLTSLHCPPKETSIWCSYAGMKSLLDYEGISMTQAEIADEVIDKILLVLGI